MEVGAVFEHPVELELDMIKLVAERKVKGCEGCIFRDRLDSCYSNKIGKRVVEITGWCSDDGVIYKIHQEDPKKVYDLKEVLADIAYEAGAVRYGIHGDSRSAIKDIISWADEFMEIHKNTDWEEVDYIETVYAYVVNKIDKEMM